MVETREKRQAEDVIENSGKKLCPGGPEAGPPSEPADVFLDVNELDGRELEETVEENKGFDTGLLG